MVNGKRLITKLIVVGLLLLFVGCGMKKEKVELPDIGFSMSIPSGWKKGPVNKLDKSDFYDPTRGNDNWGQILIDTLEIRDYTGISVNEEPKIIRIMTLNEYIEGQINLIGVLERTEEKLLGERTSQTSVVSKTSLTICRLEAIELITNSIYSGVEFSVYSVYIRKGNDVIEVRIQTLKEDFSKYESSFRKAIESIKIK